MPMIFYKLCQLQHVDEVCFLCSTCHLLLVISAVEVVTVMNIIVKLSRCVDIVSVSRCCIPSGWRDNITTFKTRLVSTRQLRISLRPYIEQDSYLTSSTCTWLT